MIKNIFRTIVVVIVTIAKWILSGIYALMKCMPSGNKVVFLSRQRNMPGEDFILLHDELKNMDPSIKIVPICQRVEKSISSKLKFAWQSLRSMYHLATGKACVLDTYWPVVSLLKHKKSLLVVQMWHAIGKIKQSGYQTLDKRYGRHKALAEVLNMHKGYDVVIAGGESMDDYYCATFGVKKDKLYNIGLPRIDYLLQQQEPNRKLLLEKYPELVGKKIVLYAPTFRRSTKADYSKMIESFQLDQYALIIKPHPNQEMQNPESLRGYEYKDLNTMQVLSASDIVITDFSAITFEAAVLSKEIYFYLFDYDEYLSRNGVNINPCNEMPKQAYRDLDKLLWAIENEPYDMQGVNNFRKKYLPKELGNSTKLLGKLIMDCIKDGKNEGLRKNLNRKA